MSFFRIKDAGWAVGGWYKDNATDEEFIVKFGDWLCYNEKLLNDLARICVGSYAAPERILISHGEVMKDGEAMREQKTCLAMKKFEDFFDIEKKSLEEKKSYSTGFHKFYVFNAIISNDDLNEENLGVSGDKPIVIDYGMFPRFLHHEQVEHAAIPFTLASFIGHRNLNGMQLIRRRHFGHDDFLFPRPFKLRRDFKSEELTYEEILLGAKKMIETKDEALVAITASVAAAEADPYLPADELNKYQSYCANFSKFFAARVEWMKENFGTDLGMPENFHHVKWSLCNKFHELMRLEEKVFKEAAQKDLEINFAELSELLEGKSRDAILALDLRSIEKSDLQDCVKKKFMLHNALISGDFETAKWLVENDLVDSNQHRNLRTHNYQLFRTTPLHAAIAIYHDAIAYGALSELGPLQEMIAILSEKFREKNGEEFNSEKDYRSEGSDGFAIKMTFMALEKLQQNAPPKRLAATKIQRSFRAHQATKIAGEEESKTVGRE